MIILNTTKEKLLASIEEKKALLRHPTKHARSWNVIKYQSPHNIQTSKSNVKSSQKEIKALQLKLAALDK